MVLNRHTMPQHDELLWSWEGELGMRMIMLLLWKHFSGPLSRTISDSPLIPKTQSFKLTRAVFQEAPPPSLPALLPFFLLLFLLFSFFADSVSNYSLDS